MAIDWDAELLSPVMALFGEGTPADQSMWPLYTPRGGFTFPLTGAVFDPAFQHTMIDGDGVPTTAVVPVLGVRTALFLKPPAQNDQVFIPRVNGAFIVKEPQDDGHGHCKLILQGPIAQ